MKEFIKDCLLFQSPDLQVRLIGCITWTCAIGWVILVYEMFIK
ncbi:hypothetical protein J2795_001119 [Chryseobacterium bernardetii]|uniref:Uncharacterized protein n=2 Tax=Chryseobacterium TaxID=59732 RepID=A0A543EK29_9FLAO|nr:hypothetical protein [Chryseobacterium vietnamense]MDR6440419.1 hypothetical protein [Chryseobacterium bernardetii]TQM21951.1 hypothetical protein FB551_1651 [Chryseobacterium aquifrigidense]